MKLQELRSIKKLYFNSHDIAHTLGISQRSALISANRYVKQGYIVRFKRNIYLHRDVWERLAAEEKFMLANMGQTPSYISLMTALDYHGVTTQIRADYIESINIKRTKEFRVENVFFSYTKISEDLYQGFYRDAKGFFIAFPEKALIDAIYLSVLGKYRFDVNAIEMDKLDQKRLKRYCKMQNSKITRKMKEHGYIC